VPAQIQQGNPARLEDELIAVGGAETNARSFNSVFRAKSDPISIRFRPLVAVSLHEIRD
jgi:hypothetical protein